jgi:hypothetical protein
MNDWLPEIAWRLAHRDRDFSRSISGKPDGQQWWGSILELLWCHPEQWTLPTNILHHHLTPRFLLLSIRLNLNCSLLVQPLAPDATHETRWFNMSTLTSNGAPQPPKEEAYTTEQNPASKRPGELHSHPAAGKDQAVRDGSDADASQAIPSALGRGVHGAPPASSDPNDDTTTNAQQKMQTVGEDRVAGAVKGVKPGSGGEAPGLESDLDRLVLVLLPELVAKS